jgi:hypothetical protein
LTFLDISINNDEVYGWIRRRPPYDDSKMQGELVFKCEEDKSCYVNKDLFDIDVYVNGSSI